MRTLVTGGAGFIGSHLCRSLQAAKQEITILDNFSSGRAENLLGFPSERITLIRGDCKNPRDVKRALSKARIVYHLAANPEVRLDRTDASTSFKENIYATHVLLEQLKRSDVETIVFSSSST